jgi:hypothetical protein
MWGSFEKIKNLDQVFARGKKKPPGVESGGW